MDDFDAYARPDRAARGTIRWDLPYKAEAIKAMGLDVDEHGRPTDPKPKIQKLADHAVAKGLMPKAEADQKIKRIK